MSYSAYLRLGFPLLLILSLLEASCNKKKEEAPTIAPPVKVKVLNISEERERNYREYSGTVSSETSTNVSFSVTGTILELYVQEGDKVKKGQILGKVKSGDYENAYNIAQAQLAEAQDGYERLKKLHDANALPDVKWVEIQQKLKQAQNMADMAQRTLNEAILKAPMNGTITKKFADKGQNVMPVEPIYEISSTGDLAIEISVGENEIGSFEKGESAKVSFQFPELSDLEGKVIQKAYTADPLTRSFKVKVSIPNSDDRILPGMIGTVTFNNPDYPDSKTENIILPSGTVLLSQNNKWFVWVVKDSVAQRKFVEVNELVDNGILIKNGLQSGDLVIVEGMQKVGTGSRVIY